MILRSIIFLFLSSFPFYSTAQEKWDLINTSNSISLTSIFFINYRSGWVVGDSGTILSSKDSGVSWTSQEFERTVCLNSVHFSDSLSGFVVGNEGTILNTIDGGENWLIRDNVVTFDLHSVFFYNSQLGWATGANKILKTNNGGKNWEIKTIESPHSSDGPYGFVALTFVDQDTGWVVGLNEVILKTSDGGETWTEQNFSGGSYQNYLMSVFFLNSKIGWAVGGYGLVGFKHSYIYHTTDGGMNWISQFSPSSCVLNSVYFINSKTGWAVGDYGLLLKTENSGSTWLKQDLGSNYYFSVYFLDSTMGWIAGSNGMILKYSHGTTNIDSKFNSNLKIPNEYMLYQNYPNPFNSTTIISFFISYSETVSLKIYNSSGKEIETLVNKKLDNGKYIIKFSAKDLPTGLYFCRLIVGDSSITNKILLIK